MIEILPSRARILVRCSVGLTLATAFSGSGCIGDPPEVVAPSAEGEFEALTYNVQGLPPEITGDDTTERMTRIGPLLDGFDVVGLQEDFIEGNHEILAGAAAHPTQLWFSDVLGDRVYGSGLAGFAEFTEKTHHHENFAIRGKSKRLTTHRPLPAPRVE